jgi:hypothetical protein
VALKSHTSPTEPAGGLTTEQLAGSRTCELRFDHAFQERCPLLASEDSGALERALFFSSSSPQTPARRSFRADCFLNTRAERCLESSLQLRSAEEPVGVGVSQVLAQVGEGAGTGDNVLPHEADEGNHSKAPVLDLLHKQRAGS